MKKLLLHASALLVASSSLNIACSQNTFPVTAPTNDALAAGFATPPQSAGMRCFWWWLNGNVTRQSITRDLEQMKAKGFSGALIFDAGGASGFGNNPVPAGPTFGTPAWRALFKHAAQEADRLGLVLSLNIQSGWNLGGPNVAVEEASKILTWSEQDVSGQNTTKLPHPTATDGFYRDIAVIAFPTKTIATATQAAPSTVASSSSQPNFSVQNAVDNNGNTFWVSSGTKAGEGPSNKRPEWLQFSFAEATTVSALSIAGREGYSPKECELQAANEGKNFRTIHKFTVKDGVETLVRFAPAQSSSFRLVISSAYDRANPGAPRNVQISEVALLAPNGSKVNGTQLKVATSRPEVKNLKQKAVFSELGGSAPDTRFLLTDAPGRPGEEDAQLAQVVNISSKMAADGTLNWRPHAGNWHIMRFGYTYSGAKVSTASGEWKGRVIDHLSAEMLRRYWTRNIAPMLDDIGPLAGKSVKYVHTDSWELGGANWTDDFATQFRKRRGYDLIPFLPIVAGKILDNRETGTRFLADFRKTIGDMVAQNHYGTLSQLAKSRGMGTHPESAGPHAGPFDGIKNYGQSDLMLSEFWVPSPHRPTPPNRYFVKQAASAAHIYNKQLVGAEGFTSVGPHWTDTLWSAQKPSFDHELCAGLNLVFAHTFTSSPQEMGLPGQEYFAGTHFNPQVTWWDMAGAYTSYLARCQFVMQQGQVVTDALYYYGDHVPNIAAFKESDPAKVLPGFDYDVINEDVLLASLQVEKGILTLPHGPNYKVLVLPDHKVLSLAALRKVEALVRAGATVIGPKTERIVSLEDAAKSESDLARISNDLWGKSEAAGEKRVGKGRVIWNRTARQVLLGDGFAPDFEAQNAPRSTPQAPSTDYIHRRIGNADVYFVTNQTAQPVELQAAFRISAKAPELWDAVSGECRMAPSFQQEKGRTTVPLSLGAYGSIFVVFRQPIPTTTQGTAPSNVRPVSTVTEVSGPWDVNFDTKWGAPSIVRFDKLESWTQRPEPGVKFYSGTATYKTNVELPPAPQGRLYLELGDVRDIGIARVRLNGKDCGITWTPPFRAEISVAAKAGTNALEIEVPNSWRNRLVGDRDLPQEKRLTQTNIVIKPDWKLVESGLLGPVRVVRE